MRAPTFLSAALLSAVSLPTAFLPAQNLLSYRLGTPANPGLARMQETLSDSRAHHAGCSAGVAAGNYNGPPRPFVTHPEGAVTIDSVHHVVFSTNGRTSIQRRQYPRVGASTGAVLPDLPFPVGIDNINGMAFDPYGGRLFVTDGIQIVEVDPAAGMAVLSSIPASPLNILGGLSYDPATPSIVYGVSTAGEIGVYEIGIGFVSVTSPIYAWPGGEAVGLAIDKTEMPGTKYVLWSTGEIYNHDTGLLHDTVNDRSVGMCFLPSKVRLPGTPPCGAGSRVTTSTLAFAGSPGFGLEVDLLPAGTPVVIWGIDILPVGALPSCLSALPTPSGDLWLAAPILVAAGVSGTSSVQPLPLPHGVAGATLVVQPAILCSTTALGVSFLDGMQVDVSRG